MDHRELLSCCVQALESFGTTVESVDKHAEHFVAKMEDDFGIDEDESLFISEVFHGCIHYSKAIKVVLKGFYSRDGDTCLRSDESLYHVLAYLGMFRLAEIGFPQYSRFLVSVDPMKAFKFLSFLFNEDNLTDWLQEEWGRHYDHAYVSAQLVGKVAAFVPEAQKLVDALHDRIANGMQPEKRAVREKTTVPEPFNLTRPRFSGVPQPEPVPHTARPRPVPATTYEVPHEHQVLELVKQENRRRVQEKYRHANANQFECANAEKSAAALELARRVREEQDAELQFDLPKASRPPPARAAAAMPIKLNTAAILREDALVRRRREEQNRIMLAHENGVMDATAFTQWQQEMRLKEQMESLETIERRHLDGQISREEAILSKQAKVREHKEIVEEMRQQSERLRAKAARKQRERDRQVRRQVEAIELTRENAKEAQRREAVRKRREAHQLKNHKKELRARAEEEARAEREQKAELIRQIRALETVPVTKPRVVDLSESSGAGLLAEMSVLELRERLVMVRVRVAEETERKRLDILDDKQRKEATLLRKLESIAQHRHAREREVAERSEKRRSLKETAQQNVSNDPKVAEMQRRLAALREERKGEQERNAVAKPSPRKTASLLHKHAKQHAAMETTRWAQLEVARERDSKYRANTAEQRVIEMTTS